jgi:hypothetical protein
MSPSPVHHDESAFESVSILSAFLKHLNMGSLAIALFVALALFAARGNELETGVSANTRDTESKLTIRPCDTSPLALQEVHGHEFTAKDFRE